MSQGASTQAVGIASSADIKSILGALDESALLEILTLRPTIQDVEEAAMWLSGDRDIFGAGEPLKDVVAEIVAVLTPDEKDQAPHSRLGFPLYRAPLRPVTGRKWTFLLRIARRVWLLDLHLNANHCRPFTRSMMSAKSTGATAPRKSIAAATA